MQTTALMTTLGLLLAAPFSPQAQGGSPHHCSVCGCADAWQRVCRVVCETKTVMKVVYSEQCEEICFPRRGCGPIGFCEQGTWASSCDSQSPCSGQCKLPPATCGKVHCKKYLVKKQIPCQECSYKCVVEYRCANCCGDCAEAAAPLAPRLPAPAFPLPSRLLEGGAAGPDRSPSDDAR